MSSHESFEQDGEAHELDAVDQLEIPEDTGPVPPELRDQIAPVSALEDGAPTVDDTTPSAEEIAHARQVLLDAGQAVPAEAPAPAPEAATPPEAPEPPEEDPVEKAKETQETAQTLSQIADIRHQTAMGIIGNMR